MSEDKLHELSIHHEDFSPTKESDRYAAKERKVYAGNHEFFITEDQERQLRKDEMERNRRVILEGEQIDLIKQKVLFYQDTQTEPLRLNSNQMILDVQDDMFGIIDAKLEEYLESDDGKDDKIIRSILDCLAKEETLTDGDFTACRQLGY